MIHRPYRQSTRKRYPALSFLFFWAIVEFFAELLHANVLRLDMGFIPEFTHTQVDFGYVNDIKEQADGKIVVGGWYDFVNGTARGRIAKLNSDGSLDVDFAPSSGTDGEVNAIEVQGDKVVVTGYFPKVNGTNRSNIARLNADGSTDDAFAASANSAILDIATDEFSAEQHLVIGGKFTMVNGNERHNIAKINRDGTLNTTFNPGMGVTSSYSHWIFAVAPLPNGQVLAGGDFTAFNYQSRNRLVRLTAAGAVDSSFNIGSGPDSVVTSLAVQPDGKYLVGGSFINFSGVEHRGIVRLLTTGAIDPTFSCSVTEGFGEIRAIGLQEDGRILIAGNFGKVNGYTRRNVARLNPDGSLDMEFEPTTGIDNTVNAATILSQDQVVLGGFFNAVNGESRKKIARFAMDPDLGGPAANPHAIFAGGRDDWYSISLPSPKVNTSSLDLVAEGTLFSMSTLGPPVFIRFTYNSYPFTESTGSFGQRWRLLYEASLSQQGPRQVVLQKGSGARETFTSHIDIATATPQNPITLKPMAGDYDELVCYGLYWLYLERATRFVYRFDAPVLDPPAVEQKAHLTSITDRNNNALTIATDLTTGRISSITDPAHRTVQFTYNTAGRCSRITTPDNRHIDLTYDTVGQLVQIKDMMGFLGKYTYNNGYLTSANLGGRSSTFTYGNKKWGSGKYVATIAGKNGTTTIQPLNGSINQAKWTTANGDETLVLTEKGKTTGIQHYPLAPISKLGYVENLLTSYSDANGKTKTFTYDERGNTLSMTDSLFNTIHFTYDSKDNLTSREDALGNDWGYQYDSSGNLQKIKNPDTSEVLFAYDPQGRMRSQTDARGNRTDYTYDDYGNPLTVTAPDGGVLTYVYGAAGTRCEKIIDTRGMEKKYDYDANNRITAVTYNPATNEPSQIVYHYDALFLLSVRDERGFSTRVERNDAGLITRVTDPLNWSENFQYDGNNNLLQHRDALGRVSTTSYDEAGRMADSTNPLNRLVKRRYDPEGNLISIEDQRQKTTYFEYDDNNRMKSLQTHIDRENNRRISKIYDASGRVSSMINVRGTTITYEYDAFGRMTAKYFGGVLQDSYTYDNAGNLTKAEDTQTGGVTSTYDNKNRVKTITWSDGKTVTYGYDREGNTTSITYPDGLVVALQYDAFSRRKLPSNFRHGPVDDISPHQEKSNQVTKISWPGYSIDFSYDKSANLVAENRSNGTSSAYVYDGKRRIVSIDHRREETSFLSLNNGYDAVDNLISSTSNFMPPPPPQAVNITASFDDANNVVSHGGSNYSTDADGNVTAIGAIFTASYDPENKPSATTINGINITFAYDAGNHPYRVTRNGVTTYHHFDPSGRLLFVSNATGDLLCRFIYRGSRLVAHQAQDGAWYYYHFDNMGNTVAITDGTGVTASRLSYSPWGLKALRGTWPANSPFTFVGEQGVIELTSGFALMGNRIYNANSGRFLQKDPLGLAGGLNLFVYANNNPVRYIDPEGTEGVDPKQENAGEVPPEQQVSRGTADLNKGEMPNDPDRIEDEEVAKELNKGLNKAAKAVDDVLEAASNIPGAPIPGGSYTTAARKYRDGNYPEAAKEAVKGTVELIPGYGKAIVLTYEVTEAIVKNLPTESPSAPAMPQRVYER